MRVFQAMTPVAALSFRGSIYRRLKRRIEKWCGRFFSLFW
jgi:hypothetical protein